jgi:pectinesterase
MQSIQLSDGKCHLFVCIGLLLAVRISAQTPAMVNWKCMPPDNQNVSAVGGQLTGLKQIGSSGFAVRDYVNGPGPDQRWWPFEDEMAVSWGNETGQVDSRWVQFAVHPNQNFSFQAWELTIHLGAKGTGNLRANIRYDTDTDFSDSECLNATEIALLKDDDSLYIFPIDFDVDDGDTLFVRIFPWYTGAMSTSKYLYVRDVTISGTTQAIKYPASAVWELTDPGTGGTGQTAATAGHITAADEWLNNTEINHYTGPGGSQRVRIAGNQWPANQTTQIDSVFVQFVISPKNDYELIVTDLSLEIAAASLDRMKANIYYSIDPEFVTAVQIEYTVPDENPNNYLPLDTLALVIAEPELVVSPGGIFYLRVYPWVDNDPSIRTGKYVCLKNVVINGEIEGTIVIDPPEVVTAKVTDVSTTFVTSGGNISADGGAPVTARGVCWNETGDATTSDTKTNDGSGSGSFISQVMGLAAGTTYYLRAYATNEAGTAYGDELTFATLDSISLPTVITASLANIMVNTAECGGDVLDWGGDVVIARGVCWSETGDPTVADDKTEDGQGVGSYKSGLSGLSENTEYFVRAYATNSKGTGYGMVRSFTTQSPALAVLRVVAKDGSGDYESVQAAFDDVPDFYTGSYTIYVKAGIYYEKLLLNRNKTSVILRGEDPSTTILTYDDYAGIAGGTSQSQSVAIDADDFLAQDITFQNTVKNDGSAPDQQAVALRINGDRQTYHNCRLLGYQDTYYTWGGRGTGRVYMKNCYVEGSVDFIFGRDIVVFDSCEIHIKRNSGTLTAASTEQESKFGYIFRDCNITADSIGWNGQPITSFVLGRPWQQAPRTVFIRCEEPAALSPAGWSTWNVVPALYAEYHCTGPGSDYDSRISISRQLTDSEAAEYTLENIFAKSSNPLLAYDWLPAEPVATAIAPNGNSGLIPERYMLFKNYPNPFNPTTTIDYNLPESGPVLIRIYDMIGRQLMKVVNKDQAAGHYSISFNAVHLASGIYFYQMEAGNFIQTQKMVLLK